jgi:hypothetical protein
VLSGTTNAEKKQLTSVEDVQPIISLQMHTFEPIISKEVGLYYLYVEFWQSTIRIEIQSDICTVPYLNHTTTAKQLQSLALDK